MNNEVCITGTETLCDGKFLSLKLVHYRDRKGVDRTWEAAQRTQTRGAVVLIPRLMPSGKYLLIRQFRPAAGRYVIEFPAGLIDPGEKEADTAVRELYEETGYRGSVTRLLPMCCSSPGMTGESFATAFMEIDGNANPAHPAQHLEGGEDIELYALLPEEIPGFLQSARERGDAVDGKVEFFFAASGIL